jgi:hypothetical protein
MCVRQKSSGHGFTLLNLLCNTRRRNARSISACITTLNKRHLDAENRNGCLGEKNMNIHLCIYISFSYIAPSVPKTPIPLLQIALPKLAPKHPKDPIADDRILVSQE